MRCISAFLAICAIYLFSAPYAASETVKIVADNWCPYNCEPNSLRPGYMIEIAEKAFEKHGIKVEYSILPWERAIQETRIGNYTAIVGASVGDAPDFVFPQIPQGMSEDAFYVKKDSTWHYDGTASLENVSLATIAGYAYNETIDTYIKHNKSNLRRVQSIAGEEPLDLNIKKLLAGRVDVLIDDENVMNFTLKEKNLEEKIKFAYVFPSNSQSFLYIAFSPSHPKAKQYAKILCDETKAMKKNGTLEKIMDNYGLKLLPEED
jgi:polar amino acid transport system substrate-binding protein